MRSCVERNPQPQLQTCPLIALFLASRDLNTSMILNSSSSSLTSARRHSLRYRQHCPFCDVHLRMAAVMTAPSIATRNCPSPNPSWKFPRRTIIHIRAMMPVKIKATRTKHVTKNQLRPSTMCIPQPIVGFPSEEDDDADDEACRFSDVMKSLSFSFLGSRLSQ